MMIKKDAIAIGELNADLILQGLSNFPNLGQEVICKTTDLQLGSSTAICACAMASLGLNTGFVGKTGTDTWGNVCMKYLNHYKIDTSYITKDEALNTGLTVSLSFGRDRALVTYPGDTIDCLEVKDIPEFLWEKTKHIHIGSYFLQKKLAKGLPSFLKECKSRGTTFSLDAGWDESQAWDNGIFEALPYIDVFLPNESETCGIGGSDDVTEAALRIHSFMGQGILVVKQGSRGATAFHENESFSLATYDVTVLDTTGAGDSFNAGYLYAYLNGKSTYECLKYGNAAGALSTTRIGGTGQCPTLYEVEQCVLHGKIIQS